MMRLALICRIALLGLICAPVISFSQPNHLKKKLSYHKADIALSVVLTDLEALGGFYFSYDSEILNTNVPVSCSAEKEELEDILHEILPEEISYRAVGSHVVLFQDPGKMKRSMIVRGYVTDLRSREPVIFASIYNPQHDIMVATDERGYYEIELDGTPDQMTLVVSRSGYETFFVDAATSKDQSLDVGLKGIESGIDGLENKNPQITDVNERGMVKLFVPDKLLYVSENDPVYSKNTFQLSFIPGLSTNGLKNSNSVNNLSFNILAGYAKATEGVEVAGLVNIDRSYASGFQFAGLGNVTGDSLSGFQVAGLSNYNGNKMQGFQVAGLSNTNMGEIFGVQIAGVVNTLDGHMSGGQIAGLTNITFKSVDGFQLSGAFNYAKEDVKICQVSGIGNYASNNDGVQVAGVFNIARDTVHFGQVSGITNQANINNGFQISALINNAAYCKGLQIGLLNFADSSSGIPIGLFSYVRSGYNIWELSIDEYFPVNVSYKTGVNALYNIFEFGVNAEDLKFSYGFGTLSPLGKKWHFNVDLVAGTLIDAQALDKTPHRFLVRLEPSFNFQLAKKFGMALGPALRVYGEYNNGSSESGFAGFSNYHFYQATYDNWYLQYWIGGKFSLRFF